MVFNKEEKEYLTGNKFSSAKEFDLRVTNKIIYRDDYLVEITKSKKIIHLGFVDHLPLIDKKISEGSWLHKKLMDSCSECYGIDINKEGINYIQDKYDYNDLYILDIINDIIPDKILKTKIDYLLIPDVIEHIGNPVVSIMEAMSCHIPIIAPNVGGVSDMVKNRYNGYLLSEKCNITEIVDALSDSCFFKDKRIRKNSYNLFLEKYSAEKNYMAFIKSLITL